MSLHTRTVQIPKSKEGRDRAPKPKSAPAGRKPVTSGPLSTFRASQDFSWNGASRDECFPRHVGLWNFPQGKLRLVLSQFRESRVARQHTGIRSMPTDVGLACADRRGSLDLPPRPQFLGDAADGNQNREISIRAWRPVICSLDTWSKNGNRG